jgi:phosphate-selective porin OprO and OprP
MGCGMWPRLGLVALASACALLLGAAAARAQTPAEIQALRERLDRLERENEELMRVILEKTAPPPGAAAPAPPAAPEKKQVEKIAGDYLKEQDKKKKDEEDRKKKEAEEKGYDVGSDTRMTAGWKDGLQVESANKDFRVHFGGRFEQDWVWWHQPLQLTPDPPVGVGNLDDGIFFRRVRLSMDGTAWEVVEFQFEFDFDMLNTVLFRHLWVGLKDIPVLGTVRLGQQKVPQGLESYSGNRFIPLMERSAMFDAFNQEYSPGVFVSNNAFDQRITWAGMFHRFENVPNSGEDFGDGEYAGTFRVSALPLYQADGRYLLHLGASYQFRTAKLDRTILVDPGDDRDVVRFRARPELRDGTGPFGNSNRFVDTGNILADDVQTLAAEAMAYAGPFWIQSEATLAHVDNAVFPADKSGTFRGDPNFWGAYVMAGYFLTGENRGYDRRFGRYDRVRPNTNFWWVQGEHGPCLGRGAWEVIYRYSFVDLNDLGINGGLLTEHTLGLNWYLNPNVKLQWSYVHANRDVPSPLRSGDVDGFGMRIHLDF